MTTDHHIDARHAELAAREAAEQLAQTRPGPATPPADEQQTGGEPSLLGFAFYLGPEVEKPAYVNWTRGTPEHGRWRTEWEERIWDQVRCEDAWGLLCTAPDMDVTLRDVLTPGSVWDATAAHSVHLLLAREVRR